MSTNHSSPGTATARERLARLFDVCARGFNPAIFGESDSMAGPLLTKAQCEDIALALRITVWPTGTGNTPQDVQLASLVTRPDGGAA